MQLCNKLESIIKNNIHNFIYLILKLVSDFIHIEFFKI
jgi:hypothetical protein